MTKQITHVTLSLDSVEKIMNNLGNQKLSEVIVLFQQINNEVQESIQKQNMENEHGDEKEGGEVKAFHNA